MASSEKSIEYKAMLRLIFFAGTFFFSVILGGYLIDENDIGSSFVLFLEELYNYNVTDVDVVLGVSTAVFIGALSTIGATLAIPGWRGLLRQSLAGWPLRSMPVVGACLRYLTIVIAIIFVSLSLGAMLDEDFQIVSMLLGIIVFLAVFIRDFRYFLFGEIVVNAAGSAAARQVSGWSMPEEIGEELLGTPALRLELARDLRARAGQLRRYSFFALAGIVALLVVAVLVIIFAGFIAGLGVGQTEGERVQALLNSEQSALDLSRNAYDRNRRQIEEYKRQLAGPGEPETEDSEQSRLGLRWQRKETEIEVATLERKQVTLQQIIKGHERTIEAIFVARMQFIQDDIISQAADQDGISNLNLLIASGITRFGILFMMIFIMQVLINLYRYTMRLSAYYLSQADAFLLAHDDNEALERIVPLLSPAQVDFGKPPNTPLEQLGKLAEVAKQLR